MKRLVPLKLVIHLILFTTFFYLAAHYKTCVYLIQQANGQFLVLANSESIQAFEKKHHLSAQQKSNLKLISQIKKYSEDSLGFTATSSFNTIYDQGGEPLLWLVTASEPYNIQAYNWIFPMVGKVSYKGFFKKDLALLEYKSLLTKGYDVELREVSAWSTLGWLADPILSNMLNRSKGALCHLIFHELFHSSYYASGTVNFNENLAEFIASKATQKFLKNDSTHLNQYLQSFNDAKLINGYMRQKMKILSIYYTKIRENPLRAQLKQQALKNIADSLFVLPIQNKGRLRNSQEEILKFKNAYFVGFMQYNGLQDSLEEVFNKIYKGKIEKMVQDLKSI